MKSSDEDLRKRGFVTAKDIINFQHLTNEELMEKINSQISVERSAAVKLLSNRFRTENIDFVDALLERLCVEKCLYTKIEICNALEKGSVETAKRMVDYLGCIGKNQHSCLPEKVSQKKSYPLPRDIIARTLGRMDMRILPVLFEVLDCGDEVKVSEVIDAIGFSLFYNRENSNEDYFDAIIRILNRHFYNKVIVWKCMLCLSSFRTQGSIEVLNMFINNSKDTLIKSEASRSLNLICNC